MAQIGRVEAQTEVKSSAEKLFGFYKNHMKLLVQMFPQNIKSIEIVGGGDQITTGTVIHWKFDLGVPMAVKSKTEAVDEKNKSMSFDMFEGDMLKMYSSLKSKLEVVENENGGCMVKWTLDFEKADEGAPNPDAYAHFGLEMAKGIDAYLNKN